jgi:hypothetical protein
MVKLRRQLRPKKKRERRDAARDIAYARYKY